MARMGVHIYIMCGYMHIYMHTYVHNMFIHTYIYASHVYTHIYICIICVYIGICICIIYTCTHIYMHYKYKYTCIPSKHNSYHTHSFTNRHLFISSWVPNLKNWIYIHMYFTQTQLPSHTFIHEQTSLYQFVSSKFKKLNIYTHVFHANTTPITHIHSRTEHIHSRTDISSSVREFEIRSLREF